MGQLSRFVEASDGILSGQFEEISTRLEKSLRDLVSQTRNSQNESYTNAVQNVILSVNNSQKMMFELLENASDNMIERLSGELSKSSKSISGMLDKNGKVSVTGNKELSSQIGDLAKSVEKIPTQHPEQIKTDLSGLEKTVKAVGRAVQSIPTAKFPDMTPNFSKMEKQISDLKKKLSQRVHVFDIERDKQSELVTKIVVKTK